MKIPYGISNFEVIRREGFFYADKTPFIPVLESAETGYRYLVFLRPRRFGKSTLVSMLEHYYDVARKDRFDALFGGLFIHANPTPEKSAYLVLTLDFSGVSTDAGADVLRRTFVESVRARVLPFLLKYEALVPSFGALRERAARIEDADALISTMLGAVTLTRHKLYVLIDEYDHFANRLLSAGAHDMVESIITKTGFVRTFYAALKSGTQTGAIGRIFVTGVSPLMLDDLSSGFNMTTNTSLDPGVSTLAGFTLAETERAVDELLTQNPELMVQPGLGDKAALLDVLEQHYNGYRFSEDATERVFNADMVLYFLSETSKRRKLPEAMLDQNVRTEYRHLQRIGAASGAAVSERRALLSTILSEGRIRSDLVRQFGVSSLSVRAPFVSLLYYLGMLTLGASRPNLMGYDLEIPNRVIRVLQWEHLALTLRDDIKITVDVEALQAALGAMAIEGEIEPFLALFHEHVLKAFSNRDARGLDEKTIKLLLMTYASLGKAFYPLSEKELAQGYTDLFLGPTEQALGAKYSWLLELKYLKTTAKPAQIEAAFKEAEAQVERYASDKALLPILLGDRALKAGMLVFIGSKKVLYRAWPAPAPTPAPRVAKQRTERPKRAPERPPPSRSPKRAKKG